MRKINDTIINYGVQGMKQLLSKEIYHYLQNVKNYKKIILE